MFASIDMTEGSRVRRKSNQFAFPSPKGDVETQRKYSGNDEMMFERPSGLRKSPILAVSDDYYSHIAYANRPEDSVEMSMKTIEMLALIKGTSPERLYVQEMTKQQQVIDDDGQTSTEGSSLHQQSSSEEFELDFDDDYLLGDSFIGFTEDGNFCDSVDDELVAIQQGMRNIRLSASHAHAHREEEDSCAEDEPEEEIFDFEL